MSSAQLTLLEQIDKIASFVYCVSWYIDLSQMCINYICVRGRAGHVARTVWAILDAASKHGLDVLVPEQPAALLLHPVKPAAARRSTMPSSGQDEGKGRASERGGNDLENATANLYQVSVKTACQGFSLRLDGLPASPWYKEKYCICRNEFFCTAKCSVVYGYVLLCFLSFDRQCVCLNSVCQGVTRNMLFPDNL